MYPIRRGTLPNLASAHKSTVESVTRSRTKRMIPTVIAKDSIPLVYASSSSKSQVYWKGEF